YGRPKVKGRTIWGDLVPFDKIWRTGANEATTISFSKDVKVQGKALAAGTYSLFTIPGKDQWMFVFNKTAKQWGSMKYDEKQDALRVKTTPITDGHEEEMTFKIKDNEIALCWEQLVVPFKVAAK
ncbi:MAG: DUF2911 domain-containing protein, partial [bacterium]|nr:DUF2911 domain-containing protein [bacterium]